MHQLRPRYHFAPPTGWMNDPNGLVWHEGEYHLFYQFEPSLAGDSEVMHWGHAASRDLVRWTHLPVALEPDGLGAIWSGSAVVDGGNTSGLFTAPGGGLVAVFTHHARSGAERQSLATSADRGRSWTKFAGNPVLGDPPPADSREFRDPKVFWHAPKNRWVMIVGVRHQLYASEDLRRWTFLSETGLTSECPDLFPLRVEHEDETRWVLSLAGRQYVLGAFDGERFVAETGPRPVDGKIDFYAAQSWDNAPAGRRVWIAWLNNWKYAHQLPDFGARGFLTIPRELALRRTADGALRLIQRPAAELASLRGAPITPRRQPGCLDVSGDALEIEAVLAPDAGDRCGLKVRASAREETLVGYDGPTGSVIVDRTRSGLPLLSDRHSTAAPDDAGRVSLHIFVDRLSVETFADDGAAVFTSLVYSDPSATELGWFSDNGRSALESLTVWPLAP